MKKFGHELNKLQVTVMVLMHISQFMHAHDCIKSQLTLRDWLIYLTIS